MFTHNLDVFDVTAELSAHWGELVFPRELDEMDAPADFDSATFTFDPFVV